MLEVGYDDEDYVDLNPPPLQRGPHWKGAGGDSLYWALSNLRDDCRAQALQRSERLERQFPRLHPDNIQLKRVNDPAYRNAVFQATAADALFMGYELAAKRVEAEGKSLEEQRAAGQAALRRIIGKLQHAMEKPGRRTLQLDEDEQNAFTLALEDEQNMAYSFINSDQLENLNGMIDRRQAFRKTFASGIALGLAALGGGAYAYGTHQTVPLSEKAIRELERIHEEKGRLLDDLRSPDAKRALRAQNAFEAASVREQELIQHPVFAPKNVDNLVVGALAGVAAVGALSTLGAALEKYGESKGEEEALDEIIPGLQKLSVSLGEVLQHNIIQSHLQQKGAARG